MSGTRHSDTHVEYILDTATWIGPSRGTTGDDARAAAALIASSGLKAEAFDDLRPAQWSKLIFNATVNAVAALTGLPHEPRFAQLDAPTDLGHLVRDLMDEGKAVAAAAGIALGEDPWEMNVHATQRGSRHYPSMLEDVEAHRPTEIDLITGALVREGDRLGVPVPLHTALYRLVKAKEASWDMRVCVVGCGAVGSLFAANLATLDDVEVWAYDLARDHVDAINRDGLRLTGAGDVVGPAARDDRRRRAAAVRLRASSRRRRCTPTPRSPRPRTRSRTAASRPCRTGSATRRCSPRTCERVIRGTTFPAGKLVEPGVVQWDVKGDTTLRPVRGAGRRRSPRSSGSPRPARAPACRRTPSPTRAGRSGAR